MTGSFERYLNSYRETRERRKDIVFLEHLRTASIDELVKLARYELVDWKRVAVDRALARWVTSTATTTTTTTTHGAEPMNRSRHVPSSSSSSSSDAAA